MLLVWTVVRYEPIPLITGRHDVNKMPQALLASDLGRCFLFSELNNCPVVFEQGGTSDYLKYDATSNKYIRFIVEVPSPNYLRHLVVFHTSTFSGGVEYLGSCLSD